MLIPSRFFPRKQTHFAILILFLPGLLFPSGLIPSIIENHSASFEVIPEPKTPKRSENGSFSYHFDVIDTTQFNMTPSTGYEALMLSSLEGLINRANASVYFTSDGVLSDWVRDLNATGQYHPTYLNITNLYALLDSFTTYYQGIVIYSEGFPEIENIATPFVGVNSSLLMEQRLYDAVHTWPMIADLPITMNITAEYIAAGISNSSARAEIYDWAFRKWFPFFNQTGMGMLDTHYFTDVRAFLAGNGLFTTWSPLFCEYESMIRDDTHSEEIFRAILQRIPKNSPVYGYPVSVGCNEHPITKILAETGKYFVPTVLYFNMGFWSHLPIPPDFVFDQSSGRNVTKYLNAQGKSDPSKLYVAAIFSDGDNLQFVQLGMKTWNWDPMIASNFSIPFTFELSPNFQDYGPAIAMTYYRQRPDHFYFVTGVGGMAYSKTAYSTPEHFQFFWEQTREKMAFLDQREVRSFESGDTAAIVNIMNHAPGKTVQCDAIIDGYMGTNYAIPTFYEKVPFMPMIGYTGDNYNGTLPYQKSMLELLDHKSPDYPAFLVFHVHCWTFNVEIFQQFVDQIRRDSGDRVEFVTVGQLSQLIGLSGLNEMWNEIQFLPNLNLFAVAGIIVMVLGQILYTALRVGRLRKKSVSEVFTP